MDSDDTFEEFQRVAVTGAAALSRAAEVLIRNAQDTKVRQVAQTAQATEDLQRRAEAQAAAAERYYAHAAEPGWVRQASAAEVAVSWKGAHQWAEIDPHRFTGPAADLDRRIRDEYGIDLTSPARAGSAAGDSLEARALWCEQQITAHRDKQTHPLVGEHSDLVAAEARDARQRAAHLTGYDAQNIVTANRGPQDGEAAAAGRDIGRKQRWGRERGR
ncbi:MAG: hypothetical protein WA966_09655 [Ornithinimicrobium sp.]